MCHNSSTCHAYVMWAELGHSHFLYKPVVSNAESLGMGTKNVSVHFGLCLVSSLLSIALLLY